MLEKLKNKQTKTSKLLEKDNYISERKKNRPRRTDNLGKGKSMRSDDTARDEIIDLRNYRKETEPTMRTSVCFQPTRSAHWIYPPAWND